MQNYQTRSAVLFIIFNRPYVTQTVFNQIKKVKPHKLYVAADGPRDGKDENLLTKQTRAIMDQIDWDCELKTLYREKNMGCKMAVSSAISWFFDSESEGIILEDDCLPDISFFKFCDELLERYRFDTRIRHITGSNFDDKVNGDASYYFSNQTIVWGWASWKRVWVDYDVHMFKYNVDNVGKQMAKIYADSVIAEIWTETFVDMKANKVDTWDYQLAFTNYFNNGLSITPNYNMISNIGFGEGATHTVDKLHSLANLPLNTIENIIHPTYILPEKQAEIAFWCKYFDVDKRKAGKKKEQSLHRRFKRLFKRG